MKQFIGRIINTGVKPNYQLWEVYLTRKLNLMSIISMINMVCGIVFALSIGYTQFLTEIIISFFAIPLIFVFNAYKNYIWASYMFYCCGYLFLIPMSLKMGIDSYITLFYFPMLISMIQLLGKRETIIHLIILSGIALLSIITIVIGYKLNLFSSFHNTQTTGNLIAFNLIVSFLTAISFTIMIVNESIAQEKLIKKILNEKEILLAEVFHRVKNNMNIITSLLNLKKETSISLEVKNALEDCRNRVFSMALVHQNIYNNNNLVLINFKEYINTLTTEIANSFGDIKKVKIHLNTENMNLDITNAIPCGLIINELITNSFKYATSENEDLEISVSLLLLNNKIVELEVRDNGKGINEEIINSNDSNTTLGIELIKSLSDQINGTYSFRNYKGLIYNLKFNLTAEKKYS